MILPQDQSLESRQSTLIKAMRFPLIVMVLFIHSPGAFLESKMELSLDGWNIYHIIAELISGHMFAIATRCFFLFSGFLFFRYLEEGSFNMKWILSKWEKRFWSLFVPFLIWNLIMVVSVLIKDFAFNALSLTSSSDEIALVNKGPLYWFYFGPADFPLWFLRDLIIMSLTAPLIYLVIKNFRWASLALLIVLYFSPVSPSIPSLQAIVYFGIGAWLGIFKTDILPFCRMIRNPATIAAAILLPLATSQVGRHAHLILFKLFLPAGIITFVNVIDKLTKNERIKTILCKLSSTVFFIYAAHEIYLLGWTKGMFMRIFGNSLIGTWISYFGVPIIVLGLCLAFYYLLNKIMPRTLAIACGGRTQTKT